MWRFADRQVVTGPANPSVGSGRYAPESAEAIPPIAPLCRRVVALSGGKSWSVPDFQGPYRLSGGALGEAALKDAFGDAVLEDLDGAAGDHPAAASAHAVFDQGLAAVAGGA